MGNTILKLLVSLGLDSSEYTKGLGDAEEKANKSSKNIVNGLSTVGKGVLVAGAAAGAAGLAFIASTIGPASDLNETLSKTSVVFGEYADQVMKFGDTSATALGMSREEALAGAATYGNLFRAMDMTEEASAGMSTGLVQLAADLASFNNMDPTEVMDKLRSGLSGQTEPLRSLGVNLNAALIEAKALEMGLWDGNDAIDAAAKAQASYALIMEQTTLAQGDFARTSDGLANQQRIIAANFKNMKATIGTALLPMMEKLSSTLNSLFSDPAFQAGLQKFIDGLGRFASKVIEAIPQVIDWFRKMGAWFSENEGVIIGILAALGVAVAAFVYTTVLPAIASVIIAMAPVLLVMAAVATVAYVVYTAWTKNWGGIQEKTAVVVAWIKNTISTFLANIQAWWSEHGAAITSTVQTMWDGVKSVFNFAVDIIKGIFSAFRSAFEGDWYAFGEKLREVWDKVWVAIKTAVEIAWPLINAAVKKIVDSVISFFKDTDWGKVGKNILQGIANGILTGISIVADAAKKAAQAALDAAKGFLGIKSPSKVFAGLGLNIAAGMASGILSGKGIVEDAISNISVGGIIAGGAGGGGSTNNNYNVNVYSNSSPDEFSRSIEFAKGYAL
jgi:phage-related protein